jgi:GNAT superfamily N-acetyltransferase
VVDLTRRPATPADAAWARRVHHAAVRDVVERQFGSWDEAQQDRFFDRDWSGGSFEVIEHAGVPCGYVCIEDRPDDVHIRELDIDPSFQGRGIGTSIIRSAIELARARGVPVVLGTLHENRGAQRLYQRLGFVETGRTETHMLFRLDPAQLDVTIRRGDSGDVEGIHSCKPHRSRHEIEAYGRLLDRHRGSPLLVQLVAERDGEVVGVIALVNQGAQVLVDGDEYVLATSAWTDEVTADDWFVRPDVRGQGIGRRLVEGAIDVARQQGRHRLRIHTSNADAARLLTALGLVCWGERPHPTGPEWHFQLDLRTADVTDERA